jgi:SAM-dependent methyltransferase
VRQWMKAGARVLELGGGPGYQASLLDGWGCQVASIDVEPPAPGAPSYFPVQRYDGRHIPFPDACFDVVFSSNVLEHVKELGELLMDIERVLVDRGIAIHILPTPAWRLWTSVAHYPYLLKRVLARFNRSEHDYTNESCAGMQSQNRDGIPTAASVLAKLGLRYVIRRILLPGAHGEYPNAASELWYFSRLRWRGVFTAHRYEILTDYATGLFYTGYGLFPNKSVATRMKLSKWFGSACRVYVLRAKGDDENSCRLELARSI